MDAIRYFLGCITLLALSIGPAHGRADELLQAARDGNAKLAVALAESGADVRQTGEQGETALHWAAFYGLDSLARLLIARGAPVNARVDNGSTALHQAAYKGHLEMVELLVASGATVGVDNSEGLTAAQFAQINGHAEVVRYLLAHGARVDSIVTRGVRLDASPRVSGLALPDTSTSPIIRRRNPVQDKRSAIVLRGLSTRLGDLPPLILKVPEVSATATRSLGLSRELERLPSSATPPDPREQPVQSRPPSGKTMWVQLGSFRSRERAYKEWRHTIGAHADLMKAFEPTIATAQIDAKGTFHRLLLGPLSAVDARRVCRDLKARKGACLVISEPSQ